MTITPTSGIERELWSREFRAKVEAAERERRLKKQAVTWGGALLGAIWLGVLIRWAWRGLW